MFPYVWLRNGYNRILSEVCGGGFHRLVVARLPKRKVVIVRDIAGNIPQAAAKGGAKTFPPQDAASAEPLSISRWGEIAPRHCLKRSKSYASTYPHRTAEGNTGGAHARHGRGEHYVYGRGGTCPQGFGPADRLTDPARHHSPRPAH